MCIGFWINFGGPFYDFELLIFFFLLLKPTLGDGGGATEFVGGQDNHLHIRETAGTCLLDEILRNIVSL